jgi:hypothetical protein
MALNIFGGTDHPKKFNFKELNSVALQSAPAILGQILPGGRREGVNYVVRNPRRGDRSSGSFKINVHNGLWADFATNDRGGDLISLIAYIDDSSQMQAARRLANMIGFDMGGWNV